MNKDEALRQEIRERIKELNIIRTDEGMPNISPLILSNPCVDEAIVGTTKNGQIVYSYDRIIDAYADDLLKEWDPKKKREEIKKAIEVLEISYNKMKEEITPKKVEIKETPLSTSAATYDSVRRKAYGTLEDDLEDTLNKMNKLVSREEK